jgi:hypothetical protein
MVTAGAMLRALHLELEHLNYEIVTKYLPIPGPDPKFKVRVVEHRPVYGAFLVNPCLCRRLAAVAPRAAKAGARKAARARKV